MKVSEENERCPVEILKKDWIEDDEEEEEEIREISVVMLLLSIESRDAGSITTESWPMLISSFTSWTAVEGVFEWMWDKEREEEGNKELEEEE